MANGGETIELIIACTPIGSDSGGYGRVGEVTEWISWVYGKGVEWP